MLRLCLHVANSSTPIQIIPVVPSVVMVGNSVFITVEFPSTSRAHATAMPPTCLSSRSATSWHAVQVLRLLYEGWHCAAFAWTQDVIRCQQNGVCNTFKIARFCPMLVSEQNYTEPPLSSRFRWSLSPQTMPGLSQLDTQHCGLCAVGSIDAFAQTSNDSDIKALEISAKNAARHA